MLKAEVASIPYGLSRQSKQRRKYIIETTKSTKKIRVQFSENTNNLKKLVPSRCEMALSVKQRQGGRPAFTRASTVTISPSTTK